MTWVLGTATRFGYVTCVSDIQVSWGDSEFRNCLKKAYKITDSLAVGFAGSIKIAFDLVDDLKSYYDSGTQIPECPKELMKRWPKQARRIFSAAPLDERANRSELLILGMAMENGGAAPVLYRLESPNFIPYKARRSEVLSIGCGSTLYKPVLEEIAQQSDPLAKYEQGFGGKGIGCGLMTVMTMERRQSPVQGISEELLCTVLSTTQFKQLPYRASVTDANTGDTREVDMPRVAESYDEFKAIAEAYGLQAAGARACPRTQIRNWPFR